MNSLQYTNSVHASSSQLLNVSSRLKSLKSTCHYQVKSSRVGCAQVDRRQLFVILASSQVKFLYRSDLQV